jgi:hypothetical protein
LSGVGISPDFGLYEIKMRLTRIKNRKIPKYGLISMGNILTGRLTIKYLGSEFGGIQTGQQLKADLMRGTK